MKVVKLSSFKLLSLAILSAVFLFFSSNTVASAVTASDWKAGRIIDDSIFTNASSMTINQVQDFLNAKLSGCDTYGQQNVTYKYPFGTGPTVTTTRAIYADRKGNPKPTGQQIFTCLKDYFEVPKTSPSSAPTQSNYGYADPQNHIPSGAKSAAQIIWEAAQEYNISPKVLLVTLQKEQSLLTDSWPLFGQYQYAMGAQCPDGPNGAECDPNYASFSLQIREGAELFRYYLDNMTAPWWPYKRPYQVNYILWNVTATNCGGSNVYIESRATAALYTYTPYQPNQAALNNMYGEGDGCSAYGNRNFWRMFNDWFGTTRSDGFTIAIADNGDPSQWVLYGSIKQRIPDTETKIAWGMQDVQPVTMSASLISSIPEGPNLERLYRINGGEQIYFVDGGKSYTMNYPLASSLDAWNLGSMVISSVPDDLAMMPTGSGQLGFTVKSASSTTKYLMDGSSGGQTQIHPFADDTVYYAWEGTQTSPVTLSNDWFERINNALGSTINSTKVAYAGNEFQVSMGRRFVQNITYAQLYPGIATDVGWGNITRLNYGGSITPFVQAQGDPSVYMISSGQRHHILWPDVLVAWKSSSMPIIQVNSQFLSLISTGTPISSHLLEISPTEIYLMDSGVKRRPQDAVLSAYAHSMNTFVGSTSLSDVLPSGSALTGFIKSRSAPQVYVLDSSGRRRHVEYHSKLSLWNGYATGITDVSDSFISAIASSEPIGIYVSDGVQDYVIEGGYKHPVDSNTQIDWGLHTQTPQQLSDGTLNRLPLGSPLKNSIRENSNYYLIRDGAAYATADLNIARLWGIENAESVQAEFLATNLTRIFMLTRIVQSSVVGDSRSFIITDQGKWYTTSPEAATNLLGPQFPVMKLNPSNAPGPITSWNGSIVKDSSGKHYVVDSARKRPINHQQILDQWTAWGSINVPVVDSGFLNLLPTIAPAERTIKGSQPQVYAIYGATKQHILYPSTYHQFYAPYQIVSDTLIQALPNGSSL